MTVEYGTMIWDRQMALDMALSYAHAAHEATRPDKTSDFPWVPGEHAKVSLAWSNLAIALGDKTRNACPRSARRGAHNQRVIATMVPNQPT